MHMADHLFLEARSRFVIDKISFIFYYSTIIANYSGLNKCIFEHIYPTMGKKHNI